MALGVLDKEEPSKIHLSERQLLKPNENTRLIEDPAVLRSTLKEMICRWFQMTGQSTYFISVDGVSGSGKSTLCEMIEDIVAQIGTDLAVKAFHVDDFIATERDDPRRKTMASSPEIFWQLLYSRTDALDALNQIGAVNGKGGKVVIERKYDRSTGKIGPGEIIVPSGRKVVIVDGVNATVLADNMVLNPDSSLLKLTFRMDPAISLNRACARDAAMGIRTYEAAIDFRVAEYTHMVPQVLGENVLCSDIIYTG